LLHYGFSPTVTSIFRGNIPVLKKKHASSIAGIRSNSACAQITFLYSCDGKTTAH